MRELDNANFIDTWNPETLPLDILDRLKNNQEDLLGYFKREEALSNGEVEDEIDKILWRNEFSDQYYELVEHWLTPRLNSESIRAWHYTRLLPAEIDAIRAAGIFVSDEMQMLKRLNFAESQGYLTPEEVAKLSRESPLRYSDQQAGRLGKFWMTSQPEPICDSGIKPLIQHWGGEVIYFWQKDKALINRLQIIGSPAIVELKVPVEYTKHAFSAAQSIVANFIRNIRGKSTSDKFDVYSVVNLDSSFVLGLHHEGSPGYEQHSLGLVDI